MRGTSTAGVLSDNEVEVDGSVGDRVWPWSLLPGGETKWMPLHSMFACIGYVVEMPVASVQSIIEYDHKFGWWQGCSGTGAGPGSGVTLNTAAAKAAIPELTNGYHPVIVLAGKENSFGPQVFNTHYSFGELQYTVPFCTNGNCVAAGYPKLVDVDWTYRITAMEDSYIICVGSWQSEKIPCTYSKFEFQPPLVRSPEKYYGRAAEGFDPSSTAVSVEAAAASDPKQTVKITARGVGPPRSYREVRSAFGFNMLQVMEQPWFSDPSLKKWGAFNFDLDGKNGGGSGARFRVTRPEELQVEGSPTVVLPEFVDSSTGAAGKVLAVIVATMPFRETAPLGRPELSLLEAVRERKADPQADVTSLMPA